MSDDNPIYRNPELMTEIAINAFARAKAEALAENDRLGIPSYGGKDGKIVVRLPVLNCTWEGCTATTKAPATPEAVTDGFAFLKDGPGIKTGWYCHAHVAAIIDAEVEIDWSEWSRIPPTVYALFLNGEQISKAHTTREAVVAEAFERGVVGHYHPDFPGDRSTYTALLPGYEIRRGPQWSFGDQNP